MIGLCDRTLTSASLQLDDGEHALIAGPARGGKSNTLAVIAAAALAEATSVRVVAPARSPLRASLSPIVVDRVSTAIEALAAAQSPCRLLIIDDADLIDDDGELERLLATPPHQWHVVAAARADRLRALYRHWTIELRRSRLGVLLCPDDTDGELLSVRLPRRAPERRIPGRGYLVADHGIELIQVAMAGDAP